MCGIVGFVGHALQEGELHRAVAALHHRGPDGNGIYLAQGVNVGLGHARLAIMDLQTGAQPLFSEHNDVVLVCNGEIYDYDRLRRDLEARGHMFRSRSDSELIIHLYEEFGRDFVAHLRGEFAFLLYDENRQELLAVRDRFGIKPLFFNVEQNKFLFASEAKALFATGKLAPRISVPSLRDYLSGAMPDSVFEGVDAVPPGYMIVVDVKTGTHSFHRYWDLDLPPEGDSTATPDAVIAQLRDAVEESVRLRLRADVPVGVYLSGGIDSAIIAATVAKYHTGAVKAFTIAFPDDHAFNEFQLSQDMARHVGAEFHSVTCDLETLLASAEDFLWISEIPFLNLHGVGKFLLSRLAREHVKVVLTGEGSDEVFLGYVYFQPGKGSMSDQMVNRLKPKRPPRGKRLDDVVAQLGFLPLHEHARSLSDRMQKVIAGLFDAKHRARLLSSRPMARLRGRIDRSQTDLLPHMRQVQYFSIKSMLAPYLLAALGDRPELAHAIEGRPPFLDHHLFDLARRIPDGLKIRDGVEKYVLREAFAGRITEAIYRRKKWPYFAPPLRIKRGHSVQLDQLLDRYLSPGALDRAGIFNRKAIRAMFRVRAAIPFESRLTRTLDVVLMFVLSVQIIERLYVQQFNARCGEFSAPKPAACEPAAVQ
ncbi:MAG: asparagine synthase (glutamine-hydrolyzing) [Candidatus Hydrogenedentes bacterium]|nr:asparagine synthase (glutamine-hydrolyzing) [Candidatus Hydrogenedentota bacterium]